MSVNVSQIKPCFPANSRRLSRQRLINFFRETLPFHRSRVNRIQEAFLDATVRQQHHRNAIVPRIGLEDCVIGRSHKRCYVTNIRFPKNPDHNYKSLMEEVSTFINSDNELEGILRFSYGHSLFEPKKIRHYKGSSGWFELIEVLASLPWNQEVFRPCWFLLSCTDDLEWLTHSFCNSIAQTPAEIVPLTGLNVSPVLDMDREAAIAGFMQSRFWDDCEDHLSFCQQEEEARWEREYLHQHSAKTPRRKMSPWVLSLYEKMGQRWETERETLLKAMETQQFKILRWQTRLLAPWELY